MDSEIVIVVGTGNDGNGLYWLMQLYTHERMLITAGWH